jgi:hypothetical protein
LTEAAHFLGDPDPVLAAVDDGLLVCSWDLCEHQPRVRELVRKYRHRGMDLADACLVAMSEKWWDCRIVTVDVTDFRVYRRRGRHPLPLLTPKRPDPVKPWMPSTTGQGWTGVQARRSTGGLAPIHLVQ